MIRNFLNRETAGSNGWETGDRLRATKEARIAESMNILRRTLGVVRNCVRQRRSSLDLGHLREGLQLCEIG